MRQKITILTFLLALSISSYAQFGIRGGVNLNNEFNSLKAEQIKGAFNSNNLAGYQIGLVLQKNPAKTGFGFETGALLSQKGGIFSFDKDDITGSITRGYHEINYIDVPVNLRFRLHTGGIISPFAIGGIYGSYALQGKYVIEGDDKNDIVHKDDFENFKSRLDYGYNYGAGLEFLRKFQLTANWNRGLMKSDVNKSIFDKIESEEGLTLPNLERDVTKNSFTVSLTYLF